SSLTPRACSRPSGSRLISRPSRRQRRGGPGASRPRPAAPNWWCCRNCVTAATCSRRREARALATPAADSPTLRQWQALSMQYATTIAGGFCELGEDGLIFNSAALVGRDGVLAVYRKAHLWDAEKLVFTPGDAPPPVVSLPFGRAGLMICYDLE